MGQHSTYAYDNLGRVWKMIDAKNQITEYGYDNQSRLATITYADGKTVTLNYDADGNLAGYDDGVTSTSYTYDMVGRKLTETVNFGPFSKSFSYSYYKNGLKHTFTAPDNTMYTYMYGLNNEFKEVQIPGVGSITIPEYTWNRPKTITFPGGTQRTAIYDALMRIQSLSVTDPGGNPLLNYQYTYDSVGNIQIKTTEHGMYAYGYDSSNRLTNVDNPVLPDETYTYDNVGNRTTASNATGSIEHNQNNELRVYGDLTYDYDANGNLTEITLDTQRLFLYTYTTDNRLVKVENGVGGVMAEYYYDPFGRRLWKDVGGARTYFFYSDEGLIAEYDASGNEIKSYGYQPDSTWTTDPLFLKQHGQYYFYQNDHLGTPQKLVAVNGAVVWSARYEAFGKAYMETETVVNNLRFPGQYFDAETGLHYNYQRYYDPKIGRYGSADPIGFGGGDVNWYGYGKNNSVTGSDAVGLYYPFPVRYDPLEGELRDMSKPLPLIGPGLLDQINPWVPICFGYCRGETGEEDYRAWFEWRFPKTVAGAKNLLRDRIRDYIIYFCRDYFTAFAWDNDNWDVDIVADMKRFGDTPQGLYERNVRIGRFEFKIEDYIIVTWKTHNEFQFYAKVYIEEQTGVGPGEPFDFLQPFFGKRYVHMAEWLINGQGSCCDTRTSDWKPSQP